MSALISEQQACSEPHSLLSVTMEITRRCNMHCKTCFANVTGSGQGKEMSFQHIGTVLHDLKHLGVKSVLLEGGEPTLHPAFLDIVTLCHALKINAAVATNGLQLNREFCAQMYGAGIRHNVYVSVDGSTPSIYKSIRNSDRFDQVLSAMDNLRECRIRFGITAVVVRHNVDDVPSLYALAQMKHASLLNLVRFNLEGRGIVNADELCPDRKFIDLAREWIGRWGGHIGFFGENCIIPMHDNHSLCFPPQRDMRQFGVILADGCVKLGRASGGISIGNCFAKSFQEIWHAHLVSPLAAMSADAFEGLIRQNRVHIHEARTI